MAHMQEPSTRHERLSTIVLCTGSRSRDESSYSGEQGQDHVSHDRRPIDANAVAPTIPPGHACAAGAFRARNAR